MVHPAPAPRFGDSKRLRAQGETHSRTFASGGVGKRVNRDGPRDDVIDPTSSPNWPGILGSPKVQSGLPRSVCMSPASNEGWFTGSTGATALTFRSPRRGSDEQTSRVGGELNAVEEHGLRRPSVPDCAWPGRASPHVPWRCAMIEIAARGMVIHRRPSGPTTQSLGNTGARPPSVRPGHDESVGSRPAAVGERERIAHRLGTREVVADIAMPPESATGRILRFSLGADGTWQRDPGGSPDSMACRTVSH